MSIKFNEVIPFGLYIIGRKLVGDNSFYQWLLVITSYTLGGAMANKD